MDLASLISEFGGIAYTLLAFVVALSVIVAIHEYGHYIVGRWSGIHAEVFSLGFGPVLYSRVDRRGTKWQIAALPFGGYVKFLGDANAASVGSAEGEQPCAQHNGGRAFVGTFCHRRRRAVFQFCVVDPDFCWCDFMGWQSCGSVDHR